ncbi:MAG: condensation domain-containing protein, partial [Chloroflexota bacterium]
MTKTNSTLSEKRRELFKRLLVQDGIKRESPRIPRRDGDRTKAPLSFAQERLWFLEQLDPGKTTYSIPFALRICGLLDVAALRQCLQEVVRRHEILRTNFRVVDERPVQVIAPPVVFALPQIDLQNLPLAERDAAVLRFIEQEVRRPFDLANDPLLRCCLLQLGLDEYVLFLNVHHIISDGWSVRIFAQEVFSLYNASVKQGVPPLVDLPIQYADYATWQRDKLQGEALDVQLNYWKQQLAGAAPVLDLPTDRPRPQVQRFRGAHLPLVLPISLTQALKSFSKQEGVTLFMTLLAGFQALLYRYSGQRDIVVGTPIANRSHLGVENLIGLFVNTLALRVDLSSVSSFRQWLLQVREATLGAYAHQDLPFEMLVDALQLPRALSHSPLFQVMFVLQNTPQEVTELSGLSLETLPIDQQMAKFDLTLSLTEFEQGLMGDLEYNTDLFDSETIGRMSRHYQVLLEAALANPDQSLAALPLLTEAERQRLLVEWNATRAEFPQATCLHELFEAQAERTPQAVALVFDGVEMRYGELDARANRLAHYLQALGVGAESLVGILVERSLDMVVGLLGILKAGGTYVPLDPHYPAERLAYMLADAAPRVLLAQQRLLPAQGVAGVQTVCLDADWPRIVQESAQRLPPAASAEDLAYV